MPKAARSGTLAATAHVSDDDALHATPSAEFYRQANAIGRAAQAMSLSEKRLIVLSLSHIDHTSDQPDIEVVVPLKLLAERGIDNPYERAKLAAEALSGRSVVIPRDDGGFKAFPWVRLIEYVPVEDSDLGYSYVRLAFNEELRPWITGLRSHYAVLPIDEVLQLPSTSAVRLYEVLWHASYGGRKTSIEMDLMSLKFALGLVERNRSDTGWTNERYTDWRDLRKYLQNAIKAFDDVSSIMATFKGIKVGRKIGSVRFTITTVKPIAHLRQPALDFDSDTDASNAMTRLAERLRALGFTGSPARLVDQYGVDAVEAAAAITERKARDGVLTAPGGFLRSILKDGSARAEATARARPTPPARVVDASPASEQLERDWEAFRRTVADEIAAAEGLDEEAVIALVRAHLGDGASARLVLANLEKAGWRGPTFTTYRTSALLERYPARVPKAASDADAFRAERT